MISGEQVVYTYDALNRATAETVTASGVTQWGQSYNYDGFGNLTAQNVIKGSAPTMSVTYNASTNRQTGDTADANGNLGSGYVYDIANRLLQPSGVTIQYAYDSGNKRVWRGNGSTLDEIAFWGVNGKKLATYQPYNPGGGAQSFGLTSTDVYFGSRLIAKGTVNTYGVLTVATVATDRLGSIGKFYPYGIERPSATTNDTEKFTGYYRDAATGLDYADQRYHQPGVGRFMTADPSQSSAGPSDPGSWNRYAYTRGDPVNRVDRRGMDDCDPTGDYIDCFGDGTSSGTTIYDTPYCGVVTMADGYWPSWFTACFVQNGGGVGGGGASAPPPPQCDVEVGYTPIFTNRIPIVHTYLYVQDGSGSWNVIDGGPQYNPPKLTNNCSGPSLSPRCVTVTFGSLITNKGVGPGLYNEPSNPAAVIYWSEPEPCAIVNQLQNEAAELSGRVPYTPIGSPAQDNWYNSNSLVFTLLMDTNLNVGPPTGVFTPGWFNYIE